MKKITIEYHDDYSVEEPFSDYLEKLKAVWESIPEAERPLAQIRIYGYEGISENRVFVERDETEEETKARYARERALSKAQNERQRALDIATLQQLRSRYPDA